MNILEILDKKIPVSFNVEKAQDRLDAFLIAAKLSEYTVDCILDCISGTIKGIRVYVYKEMNSIDLIFLNVKAIKNNQTTIIAQLCLNKVLEINSEEDFCNFLEVAIKEI